VSSFCFVIRYFMFMCAYIWKKKSYHIFIWYLIHMQDIMSHVFGMVLQYEVKNPVMFSSWTDCSMHLWKNFCVLYCNIILKRAHNCPKWGNVAFLLKLVVRSCFWNPLFLSIYCMIYWVDWLKICNVFEVYCTFSWLLKYWLSLNAWNE